MFLGNKLRRTRMQYDLERILKDLEYEDLRKTHPIRWLWKKLMAATKTRRRT